MLVHADAGDIFRSYDVDVHALERLVFGHVDIFGRGGMDVSEDGGRNWSNRSNGLAVTMFYDRRYGNDEQTGNMDITLVSTSSGSSDTAVGTPVRVTDASMPPSNEFPDAEGYSTFMGDYSGIAVGSDGFAHPAWEDTRNPIYTFDETADARVLIPAGFGGDIYTAAVNIRR